MRKVYVRIPREETCPVMYTAAQKQGRVNTTSQNNQKRDGDIQDTYSQSPRSGFPEVVMRMIGGRVFVKIEERKKKRILPRLRFLGDQDKSSRGPDSVRR